MNFVIDKQTLDDLKVFGHGRSSSLYGIFNSTYTRGASKMLEEMFTQPLADIDKIEKRASIIAFFQRNATEFPFKGAWFDAAEYYLSNTDTRTRIDTGDNLLQKKLQRVMKTDTEFQGIHNGVLALVEIVGTTSGFVEGIESSSPEHSLSANLETTKRLLDSEHLIPVKACFGSKKLSIEKVAELDNILRYSYRSEILELLHQIYLFDIYISVARVAQVKGFVRADARPTEENILSVEGLFHPQLDEPVANTIDITSHSNVIFLTGANMAGKSTFMKSLGIAVFLAHVGFPVPAAKMTFSVRNGMFTSINLPDNINYGYSHFYAEVLRLRKVAHAVNHYRNLVVIFDELFRGTNVKDAYDATVAITEAFASIKHCIFVISTHIIESGEVLKERADNINFVYLPTEMDGSKPVYTYRLKEGITADRHGMMIIRNEQILDILNK